VDTHPLSRRPASTSPRCFPSVAALSGLMPALAFGLVLSLFPPSLSAQERTVSGVVTDARTLAPVAGAQVSIEGTGVGGSRTPEDASGCRGSPEAGRVSR
jgi:hypothetical protein